MRVYTVLLGSLTFILAWVFFLFTWSIPLIVTEYTLGRFTRGSPVVAFYKFLGEKFIWAGSWVTSIAFMIRSVGLLSCMLITSDPYHDHDLTLDSFVMKVFERLEHTFTFDCLLPL